MKKYLSFSLFVLFLVGSSCALFPPGGVSRGDAPDFTLPSLDGSSVTLSDTRGKYVILNFWATWCGPCRVEMPEFNRYYLNNFHKVELFAINCSEPPSKVKAFIDQNKYRFPVLLDTKAEVQKLYGVRAYPTTLIIDPEGNILSRRVGSISRPAEYFNKFIQKQ